MKKAIGTVVRFRRSEVYVKTIAVEVVEADGDSRRVVPGERSGGNRAHLHGITKIGYAGLHRVTARAV